MFKLFYEEVDDNMNDDNRFNLLKHVFLYLIIIGIVFLLLFVKVDYIIYTGGGVSNVKDSLILSDEYKKDDYFYTCHVNVQEGNVLNYLLSFIFNWDRVPLSDSLIDENDSYELDFKRSQISNQISDVNSKYVAMKLLDMDVFLKNEGFKVVYLEQGFDTDLMIDDIIVSINDVLVFNIDKEMFNGINKVKLGVIRDNKLIDCYSEVKDYNLGFYYYSYYEIDNDVSIRFKYNDYTGGSSGGLITSLAIYNAINSVDITKGRRISGSGSIDRDGNVYSIVGVKYKLKAAVSNNIDLFFVNSENYKECLELVNKYNYDIELVEVNSVKEAIDYLER